MNLPLVLPILIPLASAALSLALSGSRRAQRLLAVAGTFALLVCSVWLLRIVWVEGIQSVQIGGWPAPYGITLVADLLSALMVLLAGLTGFCVALYSLASMDEGRERHGYHALIHILLMGVCGAFLTGDLFNMYVWFEVMLVASFVLMALGGERAQMEGAIKYVTLNLLASAVFLAAVGILYGVAGTLNMADLSVRLSDVGRPGLVTAVSMLFLVAFGIKAAVFPVFSWLPASYHTPPVVVSAVFAGLLTKVGVYALIRVFTLVFVHDPAYTHSIILVVAGLTMVTGVLGAYAQDEFRRILSFHIISQIGYMIMGLGLYTPMALAGSIFYIAHHIVVKTNLFLVSGIACRIGGSFHLKDLGGLYRSHPVLSLLFLIPALSLAGVPPLSGFFAKLLLAQAGLHAREWVIVGVSLAVGLVTLMSMMKIWAEAFWDAPPADTENRALPVREAVLLYAPVVLLACVTVCIGIGAGQVFALAERAARELTDPSLYITAVLGGGH